MRQRADTPWYPAAKLLRQPAFGDWASVIAVLRDELARLNTRPRSPAEWKPAP
jgi:hypothetical protein